MLLTTAVVDDCLQVSAWNWTDASVRDVPDELVSRWPLSPAFSWKWTTVIDPRYRL